MGKVMAILASTAMILTMSLAGCEIDDATCEQTESCSRCEVSTCCDSSAHCWYEASDGKKFDVGSDVSAAATAALKHCGCI